MSDFDWPGIPYPQYLEQQLAAEHEFLNPALHRRYETVVVRGNAMHPVIQRGDVVLIDTGNKAPADGRAVAVRVGESRIVIGYWRSNNGAPVLEHERTEPAIDLGQYPGWSIYGIVTKVIGRGISPHPPGVAFEPEDRRMADISPGQAQYIVERLIAERRVTLTDIRKYLREMQTEIAELERRIAALRTYSPERTPAPAEARHTLRKRGRGRKGHPRGIAGTFAVLTRALPAPERARYEALRTKDGLKAAIAALRKAGK